MVEPYDHSDVNVSSFPFCENVINPPGDLKGQEYCFHEPPLEMSLKIVGML